MTSMVCNCDSYGTIDYGIPILLKNPDYRTSTGVGTRPIPPIQQTFHGIPTMIPRSMGGILEVTQGTYITQTGKTHEKHYQKWDTSGIAKKANRSGNVNYMDTLKEKMYKNPPAPRPYLQSINKSHYDVKPIEPPNMKKINVEYVETCPISSVGKAEQTRTKIEEVGVMKRMDPYATTSNLDYVCYTKDQLDVSRKPIINFYETHNYPELQNSKKPLNDAMKFKIAIKDRIVPKIVYRVPNTGKCTEYNSSYKPPTSRYNWNLIWDSGVEYPDSLSGPNMSQSLAGANMYCTEYCHIGSGWPPRAAVNLADPLKIKQQQLKMNLKCS